MWGYPCHIYSQDTCGTGGINPGLDTGNDAAVGIFPIGDLRIHAEDPEKEL